VPDYSKRYKNFWAGGETWEVPTDPNPVTIGHVLKFGVGGYLLGMRFLQDPADAFPHIAILTDVIMAAPVRAVVFREPAVFAMPKWQSVYWNPRVRVEAGDVWLCAIWYQFGYYSRQLHYLDGGSVTHGNITLDNEDAATTTAGAFTYSADLYPGSSFEGSAYGIDVIFAEDE
jgi:hypothetical protein